MAQPPPLEKMARTPMGGRGRFYFKPLKFLSQTAPVLAVQIIRLDELSQSINCMRQLRDSAEHAVRGLLYCRLRYVQAGSRSRAGWQFPECIPTETGCQGLLVLLVG